MAPANTMGEVSPQAESTSASSIQFTFWDTSCDLSNKSQPPSNLHLVRFVWATDEN